MSNDDTNAMIAIGCLMCAIGTLYIVFRPVSKFERNSEELQKIRQIWGMTKPETMPLVVGILFVITGALFVLTVLAFKLAGAKP